MVTIETVVSLATGLFGGVAVVLLNREKTKAEIVKLTQEADFLRAQTDKIKGDVSDVKATQGKQKSNLEALSALVFVISDWQRFHLQKLASTKNFNFEKRNSFETELRHLRMLGLIENLPGKTVSEMPQGGNLKDYFHITEKGMQYLSLMERI